MLSHPNVKASTTKVTNMVKGKRGERDDGNDKTGQKRTNAVPRAAAVYGWQLKVVQSRIV